MQKSFCDICEKPADEFISYNQSEVLAEKVLCDPKAKISGVFLVRFKEHSTGYAGQPDLCKKCFKELLSKYLRLI